MADDPYIRRPAWEDDQANRERIEAIREACSDAIQGHFSLCKHFDPDGTFTHYSLQPPKEPTPMPKQPIHHSTRGLIEAAAKALKTGSISTEQGIATASKTSAALAGKSPATTWKETTKPGPRTFTIPADKDVPDFEEILIESDDANTELRRHDGSTINMSPAQAQALRAILDRLEGT